MPATHTATTMPLLRNASGRAGAAAARVLAGVVARRVCAAGLGASAAMGHEDMQIEFLGFMGFRCCGETQSAKATGTSQPGGHQAANSWLSGSPDLIHLGKSSHRNHR
jgi:hypothetical protein